MYTPDISYNLPVIIHESSRDYLYPLSRTTLRFKLLCQSPATVSFTLCYWNRFKENESAPHQLALTCYARDNQFDYFKCNITYKSPISYLRYYITIENNQSTYYLSTRGISDKKPTAYFFEYSCANPDDIFVTPKWLSSAIFYHIFPERFYKGSNLTTTPPLEPWNASPTRTNFFGGDIQGIIDKLDYLTALGINAIYINPIFEASSNHKYDTIDYFKIDPAFGNLETFKSFVSLCHGRDIRVILDGVFNHCGYYSPQFQDVLKNGEDSPYVNWFYINRFPITTDPLNYECVGYYQWMPKMNFNNPHVRKFFLNVGSYWITEAGIDGWRLDVCDEVNYTFWQAFRQKIKSLNPNAVLIGETWREHKDLLRGDQMDTVMNYLFRDAVIDFIAKQSINAQTFDSLIQHMYACYPCMVNAGLYNLIDSHDTDRFLTLADGNVDKLKLAVVLQMTFLGVPAIYYGDEVGLKGHNDPDCRRTMPWGNENKDLLSFYQQMIALRKNTPSLTYGNFISIYASDTSYAFARKYSNNTTYVIINNRSEQTTLTIPLLEFNTSNATVNSLISSNTYCLSSIKKGDIFYQDDIHRYSNTISLTLSSFGFEMITVAN